MLGQYIVDDQGRWWDAASWELRRHLFLDDTSLSSWIIATEQLGFIGIRMGQRLYSVVLNAARVTPVACASLYLTLKQEPQMRVAVRDIRQGGVAHASAGGTPAIRLIGDLISLAQYDRHPRFRARHVTKASAGALAPLLDALEPDQQTSTVAEAIAAIGAAGLERYLVITRERPAGEIACISAGELSSYPRPWRNQVVGLQVRQFPDGELAQWANVAYRVSLDQRKIGLEHIEANVNWPRYGLQRHRYHRLILPVTAPDQRDTAVVVFA